MKHPSPESAAVCGDGNLYNPFFGWRAIHRAFPVFRSGASFSRAFGSLSAVLGFNFIKLLATLG
jgi:hypothetical protein